MKICYWNVCNQADPNQIIASCETLQRHGVDVFCLQEIPYTQPGNVPLNEAINAEIGTEGQFIHTRTLRRDHDRIKGYGTAILSGLGPLKLANVSLRNRPNRDKYAFGHRRVVSEAQLYDYPDLDIAVAHLSYKLPFGIGKAAMHEERETLTKVLVDAAASFSTVVFGGDLNCGPNEGLDEELRTIGFKSLSPTHEPTFKSRHWYAGYIERNLDRVFSNADLVVTTQLEDYGPSDHRPVLVDVQL